jgi:DNA-binding HxlR family transcriptional regulator
LFASNEIDLMSGLRSYGDPCGIARALDVVGERWALLIVRELLFGPKRFSDLRVSLGASPNVLSQRLGELEAGGIVQQRSAGGALYELTDWGRELHPILLRLGRWGARALHRPTGALGVDALMVALESTFVPENAADMRATYELRLGEERFSVGILSKEKSSGKTTSYWLQLEPWGPRAEPSRAYVPYRFWDATAEGATVPVRLRTGALGIRWYSVGE